MAERESGQNFSLYPFAWILSSFALGIVVEYQLNLDFQFWGFTSLALIATAWLLFIKKIKFDWVAVCLGFIAVGAFFAGVQREEIKSDRLRRLYDEKVFASGDPIEIFGTVVRKEKAPGGVFLSIESQKAIYKSSEREVSGLIRVFVPTYKEEMAVEYENLSIDYGSGVAVLCLLKREDEFRNEGVRSKKEILDSKGIDANCALKSPLLIEKRNEFDKWNPFFLVLKLREFLIDKTLSMFSLKTASVLVASLLGNPYFLDKESSRAFLEGGTYHLLVISGLQVTFIGGILVVLLGLITKNRFLQFSTAGLLVWLYALSVGFYEKPVVRAALMLTIISAGKLFFRHATLLNLLALSGFILLLMSPADSFDPSFQLTFLCVLAIAVTASPMIEKFRQIGQWQPSEETPMPPNCSDKLRAFCEWLYWSERKWQFELTQNVWSCKLFKSPLAKKLEEKGIQKPLRLLFEVFVVTVAVQIWILPASVFYFHRVSLIGIFLNLWAGFLMSLESLTAIIALVLAQIHHNLAFPFVFATEIFNASILGVTEFFVSRGLAAFRLPHYAGLAKVIYFLYFLPVGYLSYRLLIWNPFETKRKSANAVRFAMLVFVALTLVILFHPFSKPSADGLLHVEFLDVGQGDAIFLKMPTGETMLIDGGGRPNLKKLYVETEEDTEIFEPETMQIGEVVVSAFLWERGYDEIDFIAATHADADHIQGLANVAENFRVKLALFGRMPFENENFARLFEILQRKNVGIETVSRGDRLQIGEVTIEILHPEAGGTSSDNNSLIVARACYHRVCFLLTGDIEKEAEAEIVKYAKGLRADVVKVAHHGSSTSSTEDFIDATKAKVAVISVGRDSPFGHPREEVVERWKKFGAIVLTTGDNGTIKFTTDGNTLQLETFSKDILTR